MANMFGETKAQTPEEYISMIDEPMRSDIQKIHDFIRKTVPDLKPFLISGMLAYGPFHYKSKSGREGEWGRILLSPRKNYISIYACAVDENNNYIAEKHKEKLKADVGKSCIRYKKVEDIPWDALAEVLKETEKGTFGI